jgi:hypothetical protein
MIVNMPFSFDHFNTEEEEEEEFVVNICSITCKYSSSVQSNTMGLSFGKSFVDHKSKELEKSSKNTFNSTFVLLLLVVVVVVVVVEEEEEEEEEEVRVQYTYRVLDDFFSLEILRPFDESSTSKAINIFSVFASWKKTT